MTEFVQVGSEAGIMFLPAGVVDPPPFTAEEWADHRFTARSGVDFSGLGDDELVDALAVSRRMRARADALEARALARLDRLRGGDKSVAVEASLELRISRNQAANRVARGMGLVARMPRLLAAMEAGDIEGYPAGQVVEASAALTDEQAREVDERLAGKLAAGRLGFTDPSSLVRAARRLVRTIDPDGQTARARKARTGRKVELTPREDTMATLSADLPAEVAASAYARVDRMARTLRNAGDERTLEQLRADVLADLLHGRDPGVDAPVRGALVFLHMPIDTVLMMSDDGCELSGYGPIPGPIAREIMTRPDSAWRKVLTDPATGAVKDLGRTRRRPSAFLRELVQVRDRECTTPGCHRPAHRCDYDHLREWHHHGRTADRNGGAKCERDHYLKDQPGWTLTHDPDTGISTITTPTGRTYTKTIQPINEPPEPSSRRSTTDRRRRPRGCTRSVDPPDETPTPF
ncbi:HNH endonuclease signature motif containing protein [Amycolatopsis palatopharyngis]|uniref:HNH endonuclease signature motif containing protein n=1 Tax=Amycolatopsis palatopharyngis TaxID=187982 RepID=UPI001FEC08D1|nr:HNH endonuclease signature motif containing protein [Amycolatopsis palatopharyngis]